MNKTTNKLIFSLSVLLALSVVFGVLGINIVFAETKVEIVEPTADKPDAFLLKVDDKTYTITMEFPDDSLDEGVRNKKRSAFLNAFETKITHWLEAEKISQFYGYPKFKQELLNGLGLLSKRSEDGSARFKLHNDHPDFGGLADFSEGVIKINMDPAIDPNTLEGSLELKNQLTIGETIAHELYHFAGLRDPSVIIPESMTITLSGKDGIPKTEDDESFTTEDGEIFRDDVREELIKELHIRIQDIEIQIVAKRAQIEDLEKQLKEVLDDAGYE